MDRRADGNPRTSHRRAGGSPDRSRTSRRARRARRRARRGEGHRLPRLRDRDARHDVPDVERAPGGHARRTLGRRIRPARRMHGVHVRARSGLRDDRVGPRPPRARRRRRRALADPRLDRPFDRRPLRRRSRRGRPRAGRARRLPRLRARRGRRRRHPPVAAGQRVAERRRSGRERLRPHERPRGLQVRHPRARLVGGRPAPDVRSERRGRRCLHPASGERPHPGSCRREARHPSRANGR